MERHFDEELKGLKERLLYMGNLAEKMINQAIEGLVKRDTNLFNQINEWENEMNFLHIEIDDCCLKLLALRQPTAADLRFITAGMKINSELERVGDQAVNISQNGSEYLKEPQLKPLIDIPRMANLASKMLQDGLDSFVRKDVELAKSILERDDEVDGLKDQLFRELLTFMLSDPATIKRALTLILISRNLERIGDHATNVAEDVIFMVLGKDVRHHVAERKEASPRSS